jgi:secondary thiamine-phosphate synthase enzyme
VRTIELETDRRTQLVDITEYVRAAVAGEDGTLLIVFVPHTTAGVVLQAAGPGAAGVAPDIESALDALVDEDREWRHANEGDRNPWSHVRAALTASSVAVPLEDGAPALGEHQAIFFCEFDGPRRRRVVVAIT